jgi:acyl-CoA thioesterase-1
MRSNVIVAACLLAILGLASCGGGSQPSKRTAETSSSAKPPNPEPSAAPSPQTPDTRPTLVTFGDSLTQGVSGKSYPAFLQDLLDQQGYVYRVDNQGVSGDTTTDGLARIENVVVSKPALVVLEFGGNDGLRGIPVESTKQNLAEMIERLQRAHIPLVLAGITLPPNYGPEYVKPFTEIFPALAKQYKVRFLPFLLVHVYSDSGLMQPDGIHPNENGNRIVAKDVFDLIRPMLANPKR